MGAGRPRRPPDPAWLLDTHVHCPQIEVLGSRGTELLDWLARFAHLPGRRAFADPARSRAGAELFLDALLAHGTTSAVVFPTVHKVSAEALFEGAQARGMRLITGKGADGPPCPLTGCGTTWCWALKRRLLRPHCRVPGRDRLAYTSRPSGSWPANCRDDPASSSPKVWLDDDPALPRRRASTAWLETQRLPCRSAAAEPR